LLAVLAIADYGSFNADGLKTLPIIVRRCRATWAHQAQGTFANPPAIGISTLIGRSGRQIGIDTFKAIIDGITILLA
jgi:hypothetical protein